MDNIPTTLSKDEVHPLVQQVHEKVRTHSNVQDVRIRMREAGEIFFTEVFVIFNKEAQLHDDIEAIKNNVKMLDWKILDVTVIPVKQF